MTAPSDPPQRRSRRRHELEEGAPSSPFALHPAAWRHALLRVYRGFFDHVCLDQAAALTYWSVTSALPLVVALVSILGVVGQAEETVAAILGFVSPVVPAELLAYVEVPVRQVVDSPNATLLLVGSLLVSLFTASAWVIAFSRAVNRIYETREMRPIWALRPLMVLITLLLVLLMALATVLFTISPDVIAWLSEPLGLAGSSASLWAALRWPLAILATILAVALLLYVTPNVRQPGWRWTWPGAVFAILASAGAVTLLFRWFGSFGDASFNRTYGALATPFVGILCMFLANLALILGIELNAGIERARELQAGIDAVGKLQLPPVSRRDGPRLARIRARDAEAARALMRSHGRSTRIREKSHREE